MDKDELKMKIVSRIIIMLAVISIGSIIICTVLAVKLIEKNNEEPQVSFSSASINERISKISELAVNKIEYRDIVRYENGEIPYLTKKQCTMIYDADVKVGIDFKKIKVEVNESGNEINITLPEAEILNISIDENSLEFYDEKAAVFNWQNKTDTVELLKYAKENVRKKALESEVMANSKKEAGLMIRSIIEPMVENSKEEVTINIK